MLDSRPKVFATRRVTEGVRAELEALFDLTLHDSEEPLARDELLAGASGHCGVVAMLSDAIDDEFLDAAGQQLRIVANHAVGYDNVDVDACSRRGVVVSNTPDVLTAATAELAVALMLDVTRRGTPRGRPPRAPAPRADAWGMGVAYTRRSGPDEEVPWEFLGFDELVARADVVSIHCPLTAETRHLFGADTLRAMKRSAYLVNTARGPVVDEAALPDALLSGEIARAAPRLFHPD